MHILNLTELKIYDRLIQSNNPYAKIYAGFLEPISSDMNTLLEFIKKRFETYPDHSYQHSMRILNYIGNLLGDNIEKLTDTECFCIILTALFHDTAMSQYDANDINTLRDKHAELSFEIIDNYFEEKLEILDLKNRIKNAVKFACASHGYNLDEFHKNSKFETVDTINGDIVRYNLLGYLLRIGDLLDLEQHRTNSFVLSKFKNNYSEEAFNHNIRHDNVELYNYNSNDLSITVFAQNIEQYKIWSTWFKYLEDDILNANTDLKKHEIFFPKPKYIINKKENFKLDIEELHFEIDDKGNIWNILSQSIYTDEHDFIRETIQNSIDASLICMYNDSSINLDYKSPRFWKSDEYCQNLKVCYSEERNQFIIIDSGIGMDKESLHNFLFKVSGSGYNDYFNREFPFPSIAKFGIGFVSCLINASDIEIYTKKINETLMYKVNLSTNANLAFLEQIKNKEFCGTVISLNLKNKFRIKNILKYIKETFSYPSVKIDCINLDDFVKTAKMFNKENEAVECLYHPHKLRDMLNEINILNITKLKPIKEKYSKISNIISKTNSIINWLNDNKQLSESYSDKEKFEDFKKLIKEINSMVKISKIKELNAPFQLNKISEKNLFIETDKYIDTLNTFYNKSITFRNKLNDDISKHPEFVINLPAPKVEFEGNWHNLVAIFDNNLNICNIIYDANSDDVLDKTGVLFIKNDFVNKSLGIECSTINGLIFSNGETCKTISKLVMKIEKSYRYETVTRTEGLIYGSLSKYNEIYDEIKFYEAEDLASMLPDYIPIYDDSGNLIDDIRFEDGYDSVYIDENNFYKISNLNLLSLQDSHKYIDFDDKIYTAAGKPLISSGFNNYEPDFINDNDNITDIGALIDISLLKSHFYQDGILLPFNIERIFPVGYFKIICNLTADSRIKLNVTRHKASEIKDDIEPWIKNIASKIQYNIYTNLNSELNELKLSCSFRDLMWEKTVETFSNECYQELIKIINKSE